jgi:hypothetical protein
MRDRPFFVVADEIASTVTRMADTASPRRAATEVLT